MSRTRFAADVAIVVLATLVVAAIGYGGMTTQLRRTAAVASATPSPKPAIAPNAAPLPVVLPSPSPQPGGLQTIDEDMLGSAIGWILVSDCPNRASDVCSYATARTTDSGSTWSSPVQVGATFSPADGDAPRAIRFVNQQDGFVYGSEGAYVTHDGGLTWQDAHLPGSIGTIAIGVTAAWETDYPCPKGTQCAYEIRASQDGGLSWSKPHQLPANFSPETVTAFDRGVAISSVPMGDVVITTDLGQTWRTIKSPCSIHTFRGRVATSDGSELWELCLGYPAADSGTIADRALFVSVDGGTTWSSRPAAEVASRPDAWMVSNSPHQAIAAGDAATFITRDDGKTWAHLAPAFLNLVRIFRLNPTYGVAIDVGQNLLTTSDGGVSWQGGGVIPGRLS